MILWGVYRCSPVPIFHSPYVHQSRCFPVPIFPNPIFPSSYIPQSLSSLTRYALSFSVCVSQSLCFPVPIGSPTPLFHSLDIPHKWFPIPMFPKDIPQSLCSPRPFVPHTRSSVSIFLVPMFHISVSTPYAPQRYSPIHMFPSPFLPQSWCSPKVFPVPMFPKDVSQSLCSPIPLFPNPDVPLKCFQSLCSPRIFPSPYVPQSLCSTVTLFPRPHAPLSL